MVSIGSDIINRMNRMYSYEDGNMLYYKANSQMFLSNCLLRIVPSQNAVQRGYGDDTKNEIEIVRDSYKKPPPQEKSSLLDGCFLGAATE